MFDLDLSLEDNFQLVLVKHQAKLVSREELEEMLVEVTRLYLAYKQQTVSLIREKVRNGNL